MSVTPQEMARRLIRSRNWHLVEAGRVAMRKLASESDFAREMALHEQAAADCEAEIRALGFEPQPPRGPRAA